MTINIDVTGIGKWELAYTDSKFADPVRLRYQKQYKRLIDPFDVPVLFDSHILAIGASYRDAPLNWYNAADIIQLSPGVVVDDPGSWSDEYQGIEPIIISRHRLKLNQSLELFIFPPVSSELRIGISPMPWMPQISLGIYQFNGTATDSTEDLINAARAQLVLIEAKIDSLL